MEMMKYMVVKANKAYLAVGVMIQFISKMSPSTVVVGDRETSRSSNGEDQMPSITSENVGFSDSVYLEWQKSEVTLEQSERGIFPDKTRRHWFSSRYI